MIELIDKEKVKEILALEIRIIVRFDVNVTCFNRDLHPIYKKETTSVPEAINKAIEILTQMKEVL